MSHGTLPTVTRRFQIEDLIYQDTTGVVFRTLDKQTGNAVAIRRFFPFGAAGGGLRAEEQSAYEVAIGRLVDLNHPALRAVICGGCDPVDGIPFIATEWIDGGSVESLLAQGPLPAKVATELITQALEVCEVLSQVLGEQAVWVETDPQTIIIGSPDSPRRFTFCISPMQWFGDHSKTPRLQPIIYLTEKLMGWQGRKMNDTAGGGLGAWLKWLRHNAATISLYEARETLTASVGEAPPVTTRQLVVQSSRQLAHAPAPPPSRVLWVLNIGLALLASGLAVWFVVRQREIRNSRLDSPVIQGVAQHVPPPPTTTSAAASAPDRTPLAEQPATATKNGGVIHWTSSDLLYQNQDQPVVVEGQLADISIKKTKIYLLFSEHPAGTDCRGALVVKTAAKDLTPAWLSNLKGKKIRLHGTVKIVNTFGVKRPEIIIRKRAEIEPIE